jgi:hypothetical protein
MYWRSLLASVAASAALLFPSGSASAQPSAPAVIPPHGQSYEQLSAQWWQQMLAIPLDRNPLFDRTGEDCALGETKRVFFLAGSVGNPVVRTCTVPSTKPVFFPIITTECSDVEPPPFFGRKPKDRAACAKGHMDWVDVGNLEVTIDGVSVPNLERFRVASHDFRFELPPEGNILEVSARAGHAASDGYFLLLAPLSPGSHTIHFEAVITRGPGAGHNRDVTYHLTVQ